MPFLKSPVSPINGCHWVLVEMMVGSALFWKSVTAERRYVVRSFGSSGSGRARSRSPPPVVDVEIGKLSVLDLLVTLLVVNSLEP